MLPKSLAPSRSHRVPPNGRATMDGIHTPRWTRADPAALPRRRPLTSRHRFFPDFLDAETRRHDGIHERFASLRHRQGLTLATHRSDLSDEFAIPLNDAATSVGPGGYAAGSGLLARAAGGGAMFSSLSAGQWYRITVMQWQRAYSPSATPVNYVCIGGV